jgi:hypothetical protein
MTLQLTAKYRRDHWKLGSPKEFGNLGNVIDWCFHEDELLG